MIRYLNNAANDIEYTNANGDVITRNPFDTDFIFISQRLSLIHSNDNENRQNRDNWNRAVKDAQISVNNGRDPHFQIPRPEFKITPEDFHVDPSTGPWDPPLLEIQPQPKATAPPNGIGPDAPARHPVEEKIAGMTLPAKDSLSNVIAVLNTAGDALPSLLNLLESLLWHHKVTADKTP